MESRPDSLAADSLQVVDRLLSNKVSKPRNPSLEIDTVVLHFISNVVESPSDPYRVEDVLDIFETYTVSAHYLIDRDGTIFRLVPENRVAYHGGKGSHPLHPDRPNKINEYSPLELKFSRLDRKRIWKVS